MVDYNPFAKTFSESRKNMKWPELDAIISEIISQNYHSVLDVGAGNGRFLEQFFLKNPEKNIDYLGIDASSELVQEAKKSFPNHNFLVANMQDFFAWKNLQKFDAIVFLASFHHLENENERIMVLENAKKFLWENGKIFLTNWNLLPQEKYQKFHKWNGDFDIKIGEYFRYYHGFSLEELEKIFIKTGFKIEKNEIFEGGRNIFSVLKH